MKMRTNSSLAALVDSATRGRQWAWDTLVRRYRPLVAAVCWGCGLTGVDAEDVAGTVWLRLVANMNTIRDPEALPGWLSTTTRRECLQLLRARNRQVPRTEDIPDTAAPPDTKLLDDERLDALNTALDGLSERDRRLLSMLFSDPPTPYVQISTVLGMPIGAIGPTRQRCLARVRRVPAVAALLADAHNEQRIQRAG